MDAGVCDDSPVFVIYNFRPDNWVLYDAMHKVPLPRMPPITSSEYDEQNSNEMPRPIATQRNAQAA